MVHFNDRNIAYDHTKSFILNIMFNILASNIPKVVVMENETYSDVSIRKVKILKGKAREAAMAIGAKEEDLVILRTSEYHSEPTYTAEKIEADPVSYLTRKKA